MQFTDAEIQRVNARLACSMAWAGSHPTGGNLASRTFHLLRWIARRKVRMTLTSDPSASEPQKE